MQAGNLFFYITVYNTDFRKKRKFFIAKKNITHFVEGR